MQNKIYYLETNALYSLTNCLDMIAERTNAHTSLFAIQEIVTQISEENFFKRRQLLQKLFASKLKVLWYLPNEMVMAAYGKDISTLEQIRREKEMWCGLAKLICRSDSYVKYKEESFNQYDIDVEALRIEEDEYDTMVALKMQGAVAEQTQALKERRKKEREIRLKYHVKSLLELPTDQKIEGLEYTTIDLEHLMRYADDSDAPKTVEYTPEEKLLLEKELEFLALDYNEEDLDALMQSYDRTRTTAYILGIHVYWASRILWGKIPKRNDTVDLNHLLYLENEHYVIVSDDKIFENTTMAQMRIKTGELRAMCEQSNTRDSLKENAT